MQNIFVVLSCFVFILLSANAQRESKANANRNFTLLDVVTNRGSENFLSQNHRRRLSSQQSYHSDVEYESDEFPSTYIQTGNIGKSRNTIVAARIQMFLSHLGCKTKHSTKIKCKICEIIKRMARGGLFHKMHYYLAEPKENTVYTVTLPEGEIEPPSVSNHAVVVVDPFIRADLGHFVFVFYVYDLNKQKCKAKGGLHSDENVCLKLAKKSNCEDLNSSNSICGQCEINFLPLVYDGNREENGKQQLLECQPHVSGYSSCPKDLVLPNTKPVDCMNQYNSHNCESPKQDPPSLPELCNDLVTCDYAVLIFGGWNRLVQKSMQFRQLDNMEGMTEMFLRNGFEANKIQIFYHNYSKVSNHSVPTTRSLPANNKALILKYIDGVCRSKNEFPCIDSLALYLNSPTLSDGSMLMWDNDGNGTPDRSEKLGIEEIFDKLRKCQAGKIYLFVDQRYSNLMKKKLEKSDYQKLRKKLLLLSNSKNLSKPRADPITRKWSQLQPQQTMSSLTPKSKHFDRHRLRTFTIYGTSAKVLRRSNYTEHLGCQSFDFTRFSVPIK